MKPIPEINRRISGHKLEDQKRKALQGKFAEKKPELSYIIGLDSFREIL